MSKIIMEGFRTDSTMTNQNAIHTTTLFWYDKVNGCLKVGSKNLNYYIDTTATPQVKVLTLLQPADNPSLNIKPVEFTVVS